jgi:hypothetical protein
MDGWGRKERIRIKEYKRRKGLNKPGWLEQVFVCMFFFEQS